MNSAIQEMLNAYNCKGTEEYKNALKEIIQQVALLGLARGNFFSEAAFYGGTALRMFHGLQRFSEDLDFSLLNPAADFNLLPYCEYIKRELAGFGFEVEVQPKEKLIETNIESAFIKGNTLIHLLKIEAVSPPVAGVARNEVLKVKLEVDVNPPEYGSIETKYLLSPIPFSVKIFTLPSLFAGKVHAVLCRNWRSGRIKGRDLYDYVWYLSKKAPLDMKYLESKLRQTDFWQMERPITLEDLVSLLAERFSNIDYTQAKADVMPFISDPRSLELWSADFFMAITKANLIIA